MTSVYATLAAAGLCIGLLVGMMAPDALCSAMVAGGAIVVCVVAYAEARR